MTSILFYTDSQLLAGGFLSLFTNLADFEPSVFSGSLPCLLQKMEPNPPEILLVDFSPSKDFAELLELRDQRLPSKIVLWVTTVTVEAAYQAMRLGVRGILRKSDPLDRLIDSLRDIAAGTLAFDKELTTKFLEARTVELTPRESQLPPLVAQGLKNKEIATALNIAEATVRIYMSALFKKLAVRDRYELASNAIKNVPEASTEWQETGKTPDGDRFPRQLSCMVMGPDTGGGKPAKAEIAAPGRRLKIAR